MRKIIILDLSKDKILTNTEMKVKSEMVIYFFNLLHNKYQKENEGIRNI